MFDVATSDNVKGVTDPTTAQPMPEHHEEEQMISDPLPASLSCLEE